MHGLQYDLSLSHHRVTERFLRAWRDCGRWGGRCQHFTQHQKSNSGYAAMTCDMARRLNIRPTHCKQASIDTPRHVPASGERCITKMFTLAESWGMIPTGRNPCRHVRYYREQSRERFLTPEEFRRLGAALKKFEAQGSMQPSAVAAIRLLMLTGCRSDEILTLKWDDVDRTARVLRLRDAKTGPRMVPLTGPVLKVLDGIERAEGVPWVLRGAKPRSRLACLSWHWRRLKQETGLHDVRVHDLRHSYASRALALGESLPVIGRLLGHARVGTTAKYAHLVRDAEKAAAARTGDSIGAHIMPGRAEAA